MIYILFILMGFLPSPIFADVFDEILEDWQSSRADLGRQLAREDSKPLVDMFSAKIQGSGQEKAIERSVPPIYTIEKNFSHIPVSIFWLLFPHRDKVLEPELRQQLRAYAQLVQAALVWQRQNAESFQMDTLDRIELFATSGLDFIRSLELKQKITSDDLYDFCQTQKSAIIASARKVGHALIDKLHADISYGMEILKPSEEQQLRVITGGAPGHRRGDNIVNYFSHRLRVNGEGSRIFFFENTFTPIEAEIRWHQALADLRLGEMFFADPMALRSDHR